MIFCGGCGLANTGDADTCRGCGESLYPTAAPAEHGSAPSAVPASLTPAPRRNGKRRVLAVIAVATGLLVTAGVAGFAAGGRTPTSVGDKPTSTSASAATPTTLVSNATTLDVSGLLPSFHEELKRLIAPRDGEPPALLVASSPRRDEPRPVTFTLIEWDRGAYHVADHVDIDCGYLEQLLVDEDQAMFLGCTGGASAHYAWAILPNRLHIAVVPPGDAQNPQGGWLVGSFKTIPRKGQPDDLILYSKRCDPDCADSKTDVYSLAWDATFRLWDLVECVPEGGVPRRYHLMNGSVSDITYQACP